MSDSPGHRDIADPARRAQPSLAGDGQAHLPTSDDLSELDGGKSRQARLCLGGQVHHAGYLPAETILVTIAVILTIRFLARSSISSGLWSRVLWFAAPAVLMAAALVPTIIRRDRFAQIGLSARQVKLTLLTVCGACAVVFPATYAGLWLLRHYGLEPPLRVVLPENRQWLSWVVYQFLYVAVAEEVFFRGYLQGNILRLTDTMKWRSRGWPAPSGLQNWVSIVLSAACFAGAHIIVQGQAASALTFLPGLILGWLFIRTRTLLAPILFHGLANTCYCIIAVTLGAGGIA
jgi:membrane protease YdiL (CAAX protease family)